MIELTKGEMMVRITYDHVHLISRDPLEAAKFYENMFAAKRVIVAKDPYGRIRVELGIEGTRLIIRAADENIKLVEDNPEHRYGLEHFCLRVDDLETLVADIKRKGATILKDITQLPTARIANIMAPDNVKIELLQRIQPTVK